MLGPFTFTFTFESEEFDKSEKVGCLRVCNRPLELLTELTKIPGRKSVSERNEIPDAVKIGHTGLPSLARWR